MLRSLRRYALLALSIVGSATLLFSCGNKKNPVHYDYETLLTESSEHRTITMMENGQRSYIFSAPLIEGYSMATNPYQEFRRGIFMTTFTSDSLSLVDATIKAQYAIYYERQKLWEAKGNVVINKFIRSEADTTITDTTKVYTQQLFWNATTEKIYSNVDTKVLQKDGWHFGVGFEADEDLKNIHFRKYSSEVEFDSAPAPKKGAEDAKANEAKDTAPKTEKVESKPDNKAEIELKSTSKSEKPTTNSRVGRDELSPMQKVEGKAKGGSQMMDRTDRPNPNTMQPAGQVAPSRPQDGKSSRGGVAKGGDKRGQDVARQTMDLNSGVTNPKMDRNGETTRPPMERNAQVGLKTDNKK
ncbi:MAG: LPS export ABC transporter periplasmic protein LptC [Alistipes sp.]|nr:LPS export ABC transporter periplasmic protein LptC [Alistipes sp.]